jgi:GntR family transcriptional repressor for pyruvate dehydrogenase complex
MELKRTRLADHLVLHLAREIVRGDLRAGAALPSEPDLAARFGVSKPIVRESVQVLASFGLIRVQQGKRTVVQDESEWDVLAGPVQDAFRLEGRAAELTEHLYEVRRILEMEAAARAAERATEETLRALGDMVERMRAIASDSRDLTQFLDVDRAFHDTIVRAGGNIALRQVARNIHAFLSGAWSNSKVTADELELLTGQHAAIARAIIERDPADARRAMEAHLLWAQQVELERSRASRPRRRGRTPAQEPAASG